MQKINMFRRILLISMLLFAIVLSVGCRKTEDEQSSSNETDDFTTEETSSEEPNPEDEALRQRIKDLLGHEPAPGEQFSYNEDEDGNLTITRYLGTEELLVIPEDIDGRPIVAIGSNILFFNTQVKELKIPDSVKYIQAEAFKAHNESIELVVLGENVETIGESAFQSCKNLSHIVLNDGLKEIGNMAFAYCISLQTVEIPASVMKMDNPFFYMNNNFTIKSEQGSYAEKYANSIGIRFIKK